MAAYSFWQTVQTGILILKLFAFKGGFQYTHRR